MPLIGDMAGIADALRLSGALVSRMCFRAPRFYREFVIPKRSGGQRRILQPSRQLKAAQGWILRSILSRVPSAAPCTGFERGQSTLSNARPHQGCHALLQLDIQDFFESVSAARVFGIFRSLGFSAAGSSILTNLTTVHGFLPQGAPTSPKLANLACRRLDRRLAGLAGPLGVVYTRYADDMTFSSPKPSAVRHMRRTVERIISAEGFRINAAKTRLIGLGRQHRVTGLVVHDRSVGLPRKQLRRVRAMIFGLSQTRPSDPQVPRRVTEILGWLAYVRSVDRPRHRTLVKYAEDRARRTPASGLSHGDLQQYLLRVE